MKLLTDKNHEKFVNMKVTSNYGRIIWKEVHVINIYATQL